MKKRNTFVEGLISMVILSIIVIAITAYFISNTVLIGPIFIGLGILSLVFISFFKITLRSIYPDIVFGFIDNGVLIFAAILGGQIAGVFGAVIGGAAGNTITDGIGGLFEGHIAEKQKTLPRTAISSSLGKMTGCLFGAGAGLLLVYFISLF